MTTTSTSKTTKVTESWALIPDPIVLDTYVPRTIHGGVWDLDLIHVARENKDNVLLHGPTGSAKTTLARAYASREGLPFYAVPMNGAVDLQQMLGKWVPTADGHFEWIDGPVTTLVRNGGVLLLDELNFAPAKIVAALYSLLDSRRSLTLLDHEGEVIRASDDLVIIAAYNPGYEGTRPLSEALANRFAHQVPFGYERAVEEQLVTTLPVLLDIAGKLRLAVDAGDLSTPVSTNRLMELEDFALNPSLGLEYAISNFVAAFDEDERSAVRQVMDLHRAALDAQVTAGLSLTDGDLDGGEV